MNSLYIVDKSKFILIQQHQRVHLMNSSALMEHVFLKIGHVMESPTVLMEVMKMKNSVQHVHSDSCVQMVDVQTKKIFAMEEISVEITAMKLKFVLVSMN